MIPANLSDWIKRWGIPYAAMADLGRILAVDVPVTMGGRAGSEAWVQSTVRLEAARAGWRLWRNNVGVLKDDTGRPVRFGLANDSPALNEQLKSSDLMGWRPVLITPAHVGTTIAQAAGRECKPVGWRYTGQGREPAQLRWGQILLADGGDWAFASGPGSI